jgi:hypothetical protein
MTLEELKQIHKTYREAKKAKVKANYQYLDEHGVSIGTEIYAEVDQGDTRESVPGIITNRIVSDHDLEIYYTVRPFDDSGRPNYDILLGHVKRDGFEVMGE